MLKRLQIENLRVLRTAMLEPGPGVNIVMGSNSSGKTSLLEAMHLIARGQSFRSHRIRRLLTHGQPTLRVQAIVERPRALPVRLAVHFDREEGRLLLRADGRQLNRASELTAFLPISVMHPDSHHLVESNPQFRRRFLDWGVFHVEHDYLVEWRRYQRALRQRNHSLRDGRLDPNIWLGELTQAGERIDELRRRYLETFSPRFIGLARRLLGIDADIELSFRQGWKEGRGLLEAFIEGSERDRRLGYTYSGPHRADIQFLVDEVPVQEFISRGQQKLLILALLIAQVETFRQQTDTDCLLLVDDLSAELDRASQAAAMECLRDIGTQVVATVLDDIDLDHIQETGDQVFHVKQGVVSPLG